MAQKKVKKTGAQADTPDKEETAPSVETVLALLRGVCENAWRGIPCLVGPTGWGKTELVTRFATAMTRQLVFLSPHMPVEVIQGIPVKHVLADGRVLANFSWPPWCPPEIVEQESGGWVIFVDELDKGEKEFKQACRELLGSLRIQRHTLDPTRVLVVGAINELQAHTDIPEEVRSRLLFVPFPPPGFDWDDPHREMTAFIRGLAKELYPLPVVALPEIPSAPRAAHRLEPWLPYHPFHEEPALRWLVVRGLFPPAQAVQVLARLEGDRYLGEPETWAKHVKPADVTTEALVSVLNVCETPERVHAVLHALCERANTDESGELGELLRKALEAETFVLKSYAEKTGKA